MIKKGIVSTADNLNEKAKITFPDLSGSLTYELRKTTNVGELKTGNIVIVAFWNKNMIDGAIIGKLR